LIPSNITKEHILKALEEINQKGVPNHRQSARFFLSFENSYYPPKFVISVANRYANGTELDPTRFSGGDETNAFLVSRGFEITEASTKNHSQIWLEKTYFEGRPQKQEGELALGKALISPQRDRRGADIYRNMRLAKQNDVVLHLVDNKTLAGISRVKASVEKNADFTYKRDEDNESSSEPGYLVELKDFVSFANSIDIQEILSPKNKTTLESILNNEGNLFYDKNLDLRQGAYLTTVPNSLVELINNTYRQKNGKDLPYWKVTKAPSIALLGPTDESYIDRLTKAIEENGQVADYWSYTISEEKIKLLQETGPFYIYCYIIKRTGGSGLVEYKLRVTNVNFSERPIPDPFSGAQSLDQKESERWFLFDKVEKIEPPLNLEDLRNYDTEEPIDRTIFQRVRNPKTEFFYIIDEKTIALPNIATFANNPLFETIARLLEKKKQIILYGPPGTGKTYIARRFSEWFLSQSYQELNQTNQVTFITLHPSYSYEEFVEGITANTDSASTEIQYIRKWGIFKKICTIALAAALKKPIDYKKAVWEDQWNSIYNQYRQLTAEEKNQTWNDAKKVILIIDEINRGDISKIFGELITLLENDKRLSQEGEILANLPYSNDSFCVPPNLYIIATMNTADRSIALIDIALRRRFGFVELSPNLEELRLNHLLKEESTLKGNGVYNALEKSISALQKINANIIKSLGRDKQIGHSFFFKVLTQADLIMVWEHEILPLMEEYFYCDYNKIIQTLEINRDNPFVNETIGIKGFQNLSELNSFLDAVGQQGSEHA
jgi:MoxR-like ATPase